MVHTQKLIHLAQISQDYVLQLRHALHEIPELGWKEEKTMAMIQKEIQNIIPSSKVKIECHEKRGGVWVDLTFSPDRARILYRADVDALPLEEQAGKSFISKHQGLMHACGHDCHAAMLLGALQILTSGEVDPEYNLRLVWQRAEEVGTTHSGGHVLVKEGVLEGISHCYGLHISSVDASGTFVSCPNHFMSRSGKLEIEVVCLGGHVMSPELGSNAIDILTEIHLALRGCELRSLGPHQRTFLVPSISQAGGATNILPGHGKVWYAVRSFLAEQPLKDFIALVHNKVECIVRSYPWSTLSKFCYHPGYPPLINHPDSVRFVQKLLDQHFKTKIVAPVFAGEDFSYYLQSRIGSYWILGTQKGEKTMHHTSLFDPDEGVLWQGVAFWLLLSISPYVKV